MKIVGLTGGIACGKTAASSLFKREGFPVIDCDALAVEVVKPGRWGYKRVVAAFGTDIILPNGEIDRELLGQLVFSDRGLRKKLNKATHLPVAVQLIKLLVWYWFRCVWVVIVDMPLLFESGAYLLTYTKIVVYCNQEKQVERLMQRNQYDHDQAVARITSQMPLAKKVELADILLNNNGSLEELAQQVQAASHKLRSNALLFGLITSPYSVFLGLVAIFVTLALQA